MSCFLALVYNVFHYLTPLGSWIDCAIEYSSSALASTRVAKSGGWKKERIQAICQTAMATIIAWSATSLAAHICRIRDRYQRS